MRFLNLYSKALVVTLFLCTSFLFATAQVGVTVSSPSNGATVPTSFTLYVSGSSSNGMSGWYVYVDNNAVWNTPGPAANIAAPLTLSTGTHSVVVTGWDNQGYSASAKLSLTVSSTTSTGTGTSVTLQSPANGASVASPVTVTASASSPNGISGWVVNVDNNNAYQVDNYSNALNTQISMAAGTHNVFVRAWDKVSGYGSSATATITVGSTSTSASSTGIPSNATVISNIDDKPDSTWQSCSSCAGPSNTTSSYWTAAYQTSPSEDGDSREFYVGGPAWTAALFWNKLNTTSGQYNTMTHFVWDFWVYVDSASLNNVWDFEFDLYQSIGGYEYMIGSHCLVGSSGGYWYGWSQANDQWVKIANAPCPKTMWTPNTWHHIVWTLERIPGTHNYKYDTLQMDSTVYTVNMTQTAAYIGWSDVLGVQWQVDTNSNGGDVHWWIDNAKVSMW